MKDAWNKNVYMCIIKVNRRVYNSHKRGAPTTKLTKQKPTNRKEMDEKAKKKYQRKTLG